MSKGPVRLAKVEEKADTMILTIYHSVMDRVETWVLNHALLCLTVAMCFLIALLTVEIFLMVGVSATESGVQYNAIDKII